MAKAAVKRRNMMVLEVPGATRRFPRRAREPQPASAPRFAGVAKVRKRHRFIFLSFMMAVLLPFAASCWYLWTRAGDQYVSTVGFVVRQEEATSAVDILGGITSLTSGGAAADSDILVAFLQSAEIVALVEQDVDLIAHYSQRYRHDPVFGLDPAARREDLADYWRRIVQVAYAPSSGLIEVRVFAFEAVTAQRIAESLFVHSSGMINRLSDQARNDALGYAEQDLDNAAEALKAARQAITQFRIRHRVIDPLADIAIQMEHLSELQQQLGAEQISLDLLRQSARRGDPRIRQVESRIAAISTRINEERARFSASSETGSAGEYAAMVEQYERLSVDLTLAEQKYASAIAAYDHALSEAQRQHRYLAAYVPPTLAETAEHPRRALIALFLLFCLMMIWGIGALIFYALKDRR